MSEEDATLEESSLQGLPVKLDIFEGPLDLLLHLIRENKLDITDIPVAEITEQYLAYLEIMKTLNLDVAGEFLVMAATLMHIKSRLLLPVGEEEGEEGEDPRMELVRQLQEYEKYKEAGGTLKDLEERRSRIFSGGSVGPDGPRRTDYPLEVSLLELLSALKKLLERVPEEVAVEIERDRLTIAERINSILEQLKGAKEEVAFEELFRESHSLGEVIVTFPGAAGAHASSHGPRPARPLRESVSWWRISVPTSMGMTTGRRPSWKGKNPPSPEVGPSPPDDED